MKASILNDEIIFCFQLIADTIKYSIYRKYYQLFILVFTMAINCNQTVEICC